LHHTFKLSYNNDDAYVSLSHREEKEVSSMCQNWVLRMIMLN